MQPQRHGQRLRGMGPELGGVFFRAQQRQGRFLRRQRRQALQRGVVGQGDGARQRQALGAEHVEKSLRAGNARQRHHALAAQAGQRHALAIGAAGAGCQAARGGKSGAGQPGSGQADAAFGEQRQAHGPGPGFAQRAGGQQPAVADATAIKHADFHVARQGVVLKAVVTQQDVHLRVRGQQRAARFGAARGHLHGHARTAAQQQRLVAHLARIAAGLHGQAGPAGAPVPARDDAGPPAARQQVLRHSQRGRRFARAACHHVANHDDRHRQALRHGPRLPPRRQRAIQPRKRPKRHRQRPAPLPGGGEGAFKSGAHGARVRK